MALSFEIQNDYIVEAFKCGFFSGFGTELKISFRSILPRRRVESWGKSSFEIPIRFSPEKPFTINLASRRAVWNEHFSLTWQPRRRVLCAPRRKTANLWCGKLRAISDNLLQFTDDCIFRCVACEQPSTFYHSIVYYSRPQSDSTIASRVQYNNALRRDNVLGVGDSAGHRRPIRRFDDVSKGESES